jgi:hypothetical protein
VSRRILGKGQMCSEPVVIDSVGGKDSTQTGVAEDDDVITAFPYASGESRLVGGLRV